MSCSYIQQNNLYYRIMIFGFLLNTTWNANLISYLATHRIHFPFNSLETLLELSSYKIALASGTMHEEYFKLSKVPTIQKAWAERIEPHLETLQPFSGNYTNTYRPKDLNSCFYKLQLLDLEPS